MIAWATNKEILHFTALITPLQHLNKTNFEFGVLCEVYCSMACKFFLGNYGFPVALFISVYIWTSISNLQVRSSLVQWYLYSSHPLNKGPAHACFTEENILAGGKCQVFLFFFKLCRIGWATTGSLWFEFPRKRQASFIRNKEKLTLRVTIECANKGSDTIQIGVEFLGSSVRV